MIPICSLSAVADASTSDPIGKMSLEPIRKTVLAGLLTSQRHGQETVPKLFG